MVRSDSGRKLWDVIPGDTEILKFDGVSSSTVYIGFTDSMKKASIRWRIDDKFDYPEFGIDPYVITLDEIRSQYPKGIVRVFINDMFWSEIWEIGNYPEKEEWIVAMKGIGYA